MPPLLSTLLAACVASELEPSRDADVGTLIFLFNRKPQLVKPRHTFPEALPISLKSKGLMFYH